MEAILIVAFFLLVVEIFICTLAVFPFLSMDTRKKLFSQIHKVMGGHTTKVVVYVMASLMLFIFLQSNYDSYKTDKKLHQGGGVLVTDKPGEYSKLFRHQRNIYLSGFVLFLYFLISRAQSIIKELGAVEVKSNAVLKQQKNNQDATAAILTENEELKEEIAKLKKMEKEFKAMKSQAEAVNREYSNLQEEYNKIQGKKSTTSKKVD
ncbi:BCAP29/BCAP31 family protein [Tieghemostelium lacteum]|uniref:Endoplasmic reticulum transmembrane protein n=1 Tax=Tieghemostelium lacteum TaxID=361077 RepID=A0A152A8S8_TIELA|nr:BCAP29/BCAP31 family protein [Tieghemostelium lacteum]|eukprot:KYR02632.1 BCAP29/BCAP31 family protein [Tieghemostelium lacteum]